MHKFAKFLPPKKVTLFSAAWQTLEWDFLRQKYLPAAKTRHIRVNLLNSMKLPISRSRKHTFGPEPRRTWKAARLFFYFLSSSNAVSRLAFYKHKLPVNKIKCLQSPYWRNVLTIHYWEINLQRKPRQMYPINFSLLSHYIFPPLYTRPSLLLPLYLQNAHSMRISQLSKHSTLSTSPGDQQLQSTFSVSLSSIKLSLTA